MADHSSFMDWCPPTPDPVHNPYQDDYVPGGWPVDPPAQPTQTAGVFAAKRSTPSGLLPAAKRVCRGLFSLGLAATVFVSQCTVGATASVVAVPTYYVVRRVQQRQRQQRHQRPRSQLAARASLSDSPWHRAVTAVNTGPVRETQSYRKASLSPPVPGAAPAQVTARTPSKPPPLDGQKIFDQIMPFQEAIWQIGLSRTMRQPRRSIARIRRSRYQTAPAVRAMPGQPPPRKESSPRTIQRSQEPSTPPKSPAKLQTPYPDLQPPGDTPPSAGAQQKENTSYESDSGTSTMTVTRSLRSNKRRIEEQGGRTPGRTESPSAAKRIQMNGPSVNSPPTPTPVIVVHETRSTITDDARAPVDISLLSPPRVRNRKVSTPDSSGRNRTRNSTTPKTPASQITSPEAHTLHTPESDISWTCDVSPGMSQLEALNQIKSPVESDISSAYNGSPPDLSQDARLFNMIMAGGGSLDLEDKKVAQSEEVAATQTAELERTPTILSETTSTHVEVAALENPQDPSDMPASDKKQATTVTDDATNVTSDTNQQIPAPHKGDVGEAAASEPKTPERIGQKTEMLARTPVTEHKVTTPTKLVGNETPELKLAKLTLEDNQFTPEKPTPKASPHSTEKQQRVTRAESKRLQLLEEAYHYGITSLTAEWEQQIQTALRHGHGSFKATDFTRVVPLGHGRGTDSWLNDEVINGYLKLVVAHGRQNDRPTQVPTHHAFVSFFYNNLESKGYEGVKRWANRAKIGGKNLLETEHVFIPINSGMHWTLCVVSGRNKTITHYNSLGGNGRRYVETVKNWVKNELGTAFKEEDWTLNSVGESPQQQNMDDCGVFTITSARQIMLGLTPMSYNPGQIPLQRKRIVAELMNGALIKNPE